MGNIRFNKGNTRSWLKYKLATTNGKMNFLHREDTKKTIERWLIKRCPRKLKKKFGNGFSQNNAQIYTPLDNTGLGAREGGCSGFHSLAHVYMNTHTYIHTYTHIAYNIFGSLHNRLKYSTPSTVGIDYICTHIQHTRQKRIQKHIEEE